MGEENTEVQQTPAAQPATEQQAAPDLNINDLVAIRSIIDVASQRGTFKAGEMEAVGKIYNKLSAFLDSISDKKDSV
jgi:hypothetical protein